MNGSDPESVFLHDVINNLKSELEHSRMESTRARAQLDCLITLVRRAWSGDQDAAAHVGAIIGAAPPDVVVVETGEGTVVKRTPKPRAVNNWAKLTIGLLNREYKKIEVELIGYQRTYLANRSSFLDDEIVNHQEMVAREPLLRAKSNEDMLFQKTSFGRARSARPNSSSSTNSTSTNRRKVQHLYQPAHHRPRSSHHGSQIRVGDLFIKGSNNPSQEQANKTFEGLYKMTKNSSNGEMGGHTREPKLSYDHPARYTKTDLFEVDEIVGQNKRRPPTATSQKSADNIRARPKSSVITGRPARPKMTRSLTAQMSSQPSGKENSDKQEMEDYLEQSKLDLERRISETKRPESIDKFKEEENRMNQMEEEFRKTAQMLQRRLNIPYDGMI